MGELAFVHLMLAEADLKIKKYEPVRIDLSNSRQTQAARIIFTDDSCEYWIFQWSDSKLSEKIINKRIPNNNWRWVNEKQFYGKEMRFSNVAALCAAANRIHGVAAVREYNIVFELLQHGGHATVGQLLAEVPQDPGLMMGVIAKLLLTGQLYSELTMSLFSVDSTLTLVDRAQPREPTIANLDFETEKEYEKWATPSPEVEREQGHRYEMLKIAISMKIDGADQELIFSQTGVRRSNLYRELRRCRTEATPGNPVGFFALIKNKPVKAYTRTKECTPNALSKSAGFSGMFQKILREHPEIEELIAELFFTSGDNPRGKYGYLTLEDVKREVVDYLVEIGCAEKSYPLFTANKWSKAIARHCNGLIKTNALKWIACRYGKKMAWKLNLNTGHIALRPIFRPLDEMQMDYHMCPSAGDIIFTDTRGVKHKVSVARWHLGLVADADIAGIYGIYLCFEVKPCTDCAIQTLYSMYIPENYLDDPHVLLAVPSGKVLMQSLVPKLRNTGFSILSVDNEWANAAADSVNNTIHAIGAAIVFGTPYAYWQRAVIERMNAALGMLGMRHLVSTYGTGPGDGLVDHPDQKASEYNIEIGVLVGELMRCINAHNCAVTPDKLIDRSRAQYMQEFVSNSGMHYFPHTLPVARIKDMRLLWLRRVVTVQSNGNPFVHHFINYSGGGLAGDFSLVKQKIVLWIYAPDIREVRAETLSGRNLGKLTIEKRFSFHPIPYFLLKLFLHKLRNKTQHSEKDIAEHVVAENHQALIGGSVKAKGQAALEHKKLENLEAHIRESKRPEEIADDVWTAFGMVGMDSGFGDDDDGGF